MATIRANFVSGRTDAVTGTGAFTMSSPDGAAAGTDGLSILPAVTVSDTCYLVLDPERENGDPEIIKVNTHTAAATTADVQAGGRAQFGTVARNHPSGTRWCLAILDVDFDNLEAGGTPSSIEPDDPSSNGSSTIPARSDHQHAIVTAAAGSILPGDGASEGVATSFARSDHKHGISTGVPSSVGTANSEGSANAFARQDHVHDIGNGAIDAATLIVDSIITPTKFHQDVWDEFLDEASQTSDADGSSGIVTITAVGSPPAVPTSIPETQRTVAITRAAQKVLIIGTVDVEYTGGSGAMQEAITSLSVDGSNTLTDPQIIGKGEVAGVKFRITLSQCWLIGGLSVGNHTFSLKGYKLNALDTVKVNPVHTNLICIRLG